ncbi:MAG TPA: hypothetical protein DCX32_02545 [Candidatus Moranbacteria bacterium]|nr:hypothetical protein [Candidatus Moranbacteria bacterium]
MLAFFIILSATPSIQSPADAATSDYDLHQKYENYKKYEKYDKYQDYKKYKKYKKKYGFDSSAEKFKAKQGYANYKLFKKNPVQHARFAVFYDDYKKYKKYKKYYSPVKKYSKYGKYKKYDEKEYKGYKNYGTDAYKNGHARYAVFLEDIKNVTTNRGQSIRAGLWSYDKDGLAGSPFKIEADEPFEVTDCGSTVVGEIPVGETARVTYIDGSGGDLEVYNGNAVIPTTDIGDRVCFEASDGDDENMLFDVNRPDSSYDRYRGKIKLQHSVTSDNEIEGGQRRIWVINELPLEHYVWGLGEAGGGVTEHTKVMIGAFRTYGRWYMEYATKWADEGFHVLSSSGSQIYRGYDYEIAHATIPALAKQTNGIIMKHNDDIVLAAYGSWTDGKTRRYEDGHWGGVCKTPTGTKSTAYPELSQVSDPYGKHPSSSTCALASSGNHMVGMSANGSLVLARDHDWDWTKILNYYYTDINLVKEY